MTGDVPRRLSIPLLTGMLVAAPIFCWLFLRRGYEPSLRRTVFTYTAIMVVVPVIGNLGQ